LITPNVKEAEVLLDGKKLNGGESNDLIEEALKELKDKLQLPNVMITRSRFGLSLLDSQNKIYHFPTIARPVFDVTGAGDTVVATLASALSCGADLPLACTLAIAASGVVVSKVGTATASIPEIQEALASYSE
jgi:D-beta-D-heptose 7-phosphate kinase/D-beta-D-heptose 1-phosphate adenosyltransferase